jgi:hypothetical protein
MVAAAGTTDLRVCAPRGVGWRAWAIERDGLTVELWGLRGAWLSCIWRSGFFIGRPLGVSAEPSAALARAEAWLTTTELKPLPPDAKLPRIVHRVVERAIGADANETRAATALSLAFGAAPPDLGRLAWHGHGLRLAQCPAPGSPSASEAARAYALMARPTGHEMITLLRAAAAHDRDPQRSSDRGSMRPLPELWEPQAPVSRIAIAANFAMAMLSGVPETENWLTVEEVAAILRMSVDYVGALIQAGYLEVVRLPDLGWGPQTRIPPRSLTILEQRLTETTECASPTTSPSPATPSWFADPTVPTGILSSTTRPAVACASFRPEPPTRPSLKPPGRGSPPAPKRPTRKMPPRKPSP